MRVVRKGFLAVLLGWALLCPPFAEAAIVTPMKASAYLVIGHNSNASIVWDKANNQGEIKPSDRWLGNSSPIEKIRKSGLWLVQGLDKEGLTEEEFEKLKQIVSAK